MKYKLLLICLSIILISGCSLNSKTCDCDSECKNYVSNEIDKVTEDQAYELIQKYEGSPNENIFVDGLTESTMFSTAISNVKNKYIYRIMASVLKNLDGVKKTEYGYEIETTYGTINIEEQSVINAYEYEGLNSAYKELYGKTLEKKDFDMGIVYYKYFDVEDSFLEIVSPTGFYSIFKYAITNISTDKNKLIISVGYAIFDADIGNENGGFTSEIDSDKVFNLDELTADDFNKTLVDTYYDKLKNVDFIFEKQNNSYVLVSVSRS